MSVKSEPQSSMKQHAEQYSHGKVSCKWSPPFLKGHENACKANISRHINSRSCGFYRKKIFSHKVNLNKLTCKVRQCRMLRCQQHSKLQSRATSWRTRRRWSWLSEWERWRTKPSRAGQTTRAVKVSLWYFLKAWNPLSDSWCVETC